MRSGAFVSVIEMKATPGKGDSYDLQPNNCMYTPACINMLQTILQQMHTLCLRAKHDL